MQHVRRSINRFFEFRCSLALYFVGEFSCGAFLKYAHVVRAGLTSRAADGLTIVCRGAPARLDSWRFRIAGCVGGLHEMDALLVSSFFFSLRGACSMQFGR